MKKLIPALALFTLLFLFLQIRYGIFFLEMEAKQLFVWDLPSLRDALLVPGGAASLLNSFIVQFFHVPVAGPIIASAAISTIYFLCCPKLSGTVIAHVLLPLGLLPGALLLTDVCCINLSFISITIFLLLALSAFLHARSDARPTINGVKVLMTGLILYLAVGDPAVCYLLAVVILDVARKKQPVPSIISALIVLGTIILSKRACWPDEIKFAIPQGQHLFYIAWAVFTAVLTETFMTRTSDSRKKGRTFLLLLSAAVVVVTGISVYQKHRNIRNEQLAVLSYYAQNSNWDKLIRYCRTIDMNNYMLLNYANLALSNQGRLLEHYTDYRHDSDKALCIKPDYTADGMEFQAMIHYHIGNVAGAQRMAFEAVQINVRPWLLKMLAKTNIITGQYAVAEKYISILEKTIFYRRWAQSMRDMMTDPQERRSLPDTDKFMHQDNFFSDCLNIMDADVPNSPARSYLIAYILISRDANFLLQFVDRFYGTPALPSITDDMQYGLVAATMDLEYCRQHGVNEKIIQGYLRSKR